MYKFYKDMVNSSDKWKLPCVHLKRWMPNGSMGYILMYWKRLTIDRWGNLSRIPKVVKYIVNDRWNMGMIGQIVYHVPILRPKHERRWLRCTSNTLLEKMLEKVCWCTHCKMESYKCLKRFTPNCFKRKNAFLNQSG